MRGKAKKVYPKDSEIRITPAYAGKSSQSVEVFCIIWDHPRLCGEKLTGITRKRKSFGITPAYAGKSHDMGLGKTFTGDHPRLCGEKPRRAERVHP